MFMEILAGLKLVVLNEVDFQIDVLQLQAIFKDIVLGGEQLVLYRRENHCINLAGRKLGLGCSKRGFGVLQHFRKLGLKLQVIGFILILDGNLIVDFLLFLGNGKFAFFGLNFGSGNSFIVSETVKNGKAQLQSKLMVFVVVQLLAEGVNATCTAIDRTVVKGGKTVIGR